MMSPARAENVCQRSLFHTVDRYRTTASLPTPKGCPLGARNARARTTPSTSSASVPDHQLRATKSDSPTRSSISHSLPDHAKQIEVRSVPRDRCACGRDPFGLRDDSPSPPRHQQRVDTQIAWSTSARIGMSPTAGSWAFACTLSDRTWCARDRCQFPHALFTPSPAKTTAEQALCRWTGVRFAQVPPSSQNRKSAAQRGRDVITRAPHGSPHDLQNPW